MGDLAHQFFNTCLTVDYPCVVNTQYINPCSCGGWFTCQYDTKIIAQSCSEGTLYNHENKNCDAEASVAVVNKLCEMDAPWKRCAAENASPDVISSLEARCTGVSPTTSATTTTTASITSTLMSTASSITTAVQDGGPEQPQKNIGALIGGVVGGVVFLALLVILVIWCKRKSSRKEEAPMDETYADIDDVVMNDPTYKESVGPQLPDRPRFTFLSSQKGQDRMVTYDNPGYKPSTHGGDVIQGKITPNDAVVFTPESVYTKEGPPGAPIHPDPGQQVTDYGYELPHIAGGHRDSTHSKEC